MQEVFEMEEVAPVGGAGEEKKMEKEKAVVSSAGDKHIPQFDFNG